MSTTGNTAFPTTFAPPVPPLVFDVRRMARRLGINQKAMRELAENGDVPALRVTGGFLFNPTSVEQALADKAGETKQ